MSETSTNIRPWDRPSERRPVGRPENTEPKDPAKVRKIHKLREQGKRWRTIGPLVDMTGQGACLLYKRWEKWASTPD